MQKPIGIGSKTYGSCSVFLYIFDVEFLTHMFHLNNLLFNMWFLTPNTSSGLFPTTLLPVVPYMWAFQEPPMHASSLLNGSACMPYALIEFISMLHTCTPQPPPFNELHALCLHGAPLHAHHYHPHACMPYVGVEPLVIFIDPFFNRATVSSHRLKKSRIVSHLL